MQSNASDSLATRFQASLQSLLSTLSQTTSHFIRCIKPNAFQLAALSAWDPALVRRQLHTSGTWDLLVRVRGVGGGGGSAYPLRFKHKEFWTRYERLVVWETKTAPSAAAKPAAAAGSSGSAGPLSPRAGGGASNAANAASSEELAHRCSQLLWRFCPLPTTPPPPPPASAAAGAPDSAQVLQALPAWQIGKTLVFLSRATHNALEALITAAATRRVVVLQSRWRARRVRRRWMALRKAWRDLKQATNTAQTPAAAKPGTEKQRIVVLEQALNAAQAGTYHLCVLRCAVLERVLTVECCALCCAAAVPAHLLSAARGLTAALKKQIAVDTCERDLKSAAASAVRTAADRIKALQTALDRVRRVTALRAPLRCALCLSSLCMVCVCRRWRAGFRPISLRSTRCRAPSARCNS